MNNKFDDICIYMTSLRESHDRRKKTTEQFKKLGITNFEFFPTNIEKCEDISVIAQYPQYSKFIQGVVISHLEMMRHWYILTNEPYAIFCEDDNDFSVSEYWNFSIQEFIQNLPSNWDCVQLMRYRLPPAEYGPQCNDSILKLFSGRYWGTCALMKRSYVKRCLDMHIKQLGTYDLRIIQDGMYPEPMDPGTIEYVENVLYLNKGVIYNFPLLVQLDPFVSSSTISNLNNEEKNIWRIQREFFLDLWKTRGKDLNLKEALICFSG